MLQESLPLLTTSPPLAVMHIQVSALNQTANVAILGLGTWMGMEHGLKNDAMLQFITTLHCICTTKGASRETLED